MKLTEKGEEYNKNLNNIMQDLIEEGYLKRDIIASLNHCSEFNHSDEGDEILSFIEGILWERRRIKKDIKKVGR